MYLMITSVQPNLFYGLKGHKFTVGNSFLVFIVAQHCPVLDITFTQYYKNEALGNFHLKFFNTDTASTLEKCSHQFDAVDI